jgi:hypothetical protein
MRTNIIVSFLIALTFCEGAIWKIATVTSGQHSIPAGKYNGAATAIGNSVAVLGGYQLCNTSDGENIFDPKIHFFNVNTGVWSTPETHGYQPGNRSNFGFVSHAATNSDFIYGGTTVICGLIPVALFGDFIRFNRNTNTYTNIVLSVNPGIRVGPSMVIVGDFIYLQGGLDGSFNGLNDVWRYSIYANIWEQLTNNTAGSYDAPGSAPGARFDAPFTYVEEENSIYLHNGDFPPLASFVYNLTDIWRFKLASNTWEFVSGNALSDRTATAEGTVGCYLVSFGGDISFGDRCLNNLTGNGDNATIVTSIYDVRYNNREFVPVSVDDHLIHPLKGMSYAMVGTKLYVIGGYYFDCVLGEGTGFYLWNSQVWYLDLATLL